MIEFDVYTILALASGFIILSYVISLISTKTRIPTVLMLLALGITVRELLISTDNYRDIPIDVLQLFGVLGLILILLEAGLDLNLSRSKKSVIKHAASSSLFVLGLSTAGIGAVMHFGLNQDWHTSLVYAIPLSVISSSIVASSIQYLSEQKREFLIYESSLSDILGILLFNFLITDQAFSAGLLAYNIASIALAIAISIAVSFLLIWLLAKAKVNVKAFLIFATLFLVYSIGHFWNLPTLLVVLIFGLIINNWKLLQPQKLKGVLSVRSVDEEAENMKSVTLEAAFLIRTFFFALFGYTIDVGVLADKKVLAVGGLIVLIIFLVRFIYLWIFSRKYILPELFFAPRGLVTIVLFYSIPATFAFDAFGEGVIFFVILATILIMMFGSIFFTPHQATRESEEGVVKSG